jgi:hypothetical protein
LDLSSRPFARDFGVLVRLLRGRISKGGISRWPFHARLTHSGSAPDIRSANFDAQ